jgi:hypothetical protein
VASIDAFLDITLADGRRLRLAGLRPPAPSPTRADWPQEAARRLGSWLVGREIAFAPEGPADRWGLVPVAARALSPGGAGEGGAGALAPAILAAGLAFLDVSAADEVCLAALRVAEDSARAAKLGLWGDPYYSVFAAGDRGALMAHEGRVVLVEGRVANLGSSGPRTYLNFGYRRGTDLSVVILKKNLAAFERVGMTPQSLVGRELRLRGLLDSHFGPRIEAFSPDQIELLGPVQAPGGADR